MSGQPGRSTQSGTRSKRSTKTGAKSQKRASSSADLESGPDGVLGDYEASLALRDADKLYYRIGEVSRLTGVKAHVLRYWETEFRWMSPPKSRSKQRLYRKRDIEFVWLLKRLLWDERYTIAGARQRIQELGVEGALALLDQSSSDSQTSEAEPAGANSTPTDASSLEPEKPPALAAWVSFRVALEEMEGELVALKGTLQDTP
jgi:DNA-binding transcriptional MerR regulator